MNEIKIKISSIIREAVIWAVLLVVAFLTNVYAIITYDGQWPELISQLHVVFILSVVYYVILAIIRAIVHGIKFIVKRWVIPAKA